MTALLSVLWGWVGKFFAEKVLIWSAWKLLLSFSLTIVLPIVLYNVLLGIYLLS